MSSMEVTYLVIIVILLFFSAFFSGSETAFVSLQKVRLEHMMQNKVSGARLVARLMKRPERFLSTVLFGNNLVNTAAAVLATVIATRVWPAHGILIATVGMTVILLIFTETLPKVLGIHHAERFALTVARPIQVISWIFTPFVVVLGWVASGLTKLGGTTPIPRSLVTEEEIRAMISAGWREGTVETEAAEMLHNVFDFADRPVHDVMVPRPEVVFVESGTTIGDFLALYIQNPLSRFPVYQETRDNIIGILSIKDVLMALAKGTISNESSIDDLVRPAYFTPETKPISELFTEMRDHNYHMAVAVDEFGGIAGVVSLSRLIEEVVGPVGDELAGLDRDYEVINDYTFQIDGGMRIEEANEEMKLALPEGDYETIAGFILYLLGRFPRQGEQLRYKDLKFIITKMHKRKIEQVLLTKEKKTGESKDKDATSADKV
ncbi:MAG: hemolysin family protein [Chloroflexota bacterium]